MRWTLGAVAAASLAGTAYAQAESHKVTDPESGLSWASYATDKGVTFRVAVPEGVAEKAEFDTAFQIVAPANLGWVGLAWGGSMTYNPLAITWPSADKKSVVVSSRMAYGYYVPPAYEDAKYTVLTKATHVNATHWQVTATCKGCSKWGDDDTGITHLDAKGENALAFAYSAVPVDSPDKLDSTFSIHDMVGHWVHDFSQGANAGFAAGTAKIA